MASTKELRTRIKSISNTAKVTGAMQMIAASKLRKAQNSAEDFNLFSAGYDEIKNSVMGSVNFDLLSEISPLFNVGEINSEEKILYVVISSNRGLAGPLFGNLVKVLEAHKINEDSAKFISVGKKIDIIIEKKIEGKNSIIKFSIPITKSTTIEIAKNEENNLVSKKIVTKRQKYNR